MQSPSKSKNSHIHLFRQEAKVSIHCFKADGKCFNPKETVVPRSNKSQTTQKFLPEPSTLSFNRGKLGEMGRSLSPPHPHPTFVPPSQMKCEPGWSRTPEKLPFARQSQHLWAGQSPCCSSARQGPLAPAPRSQQPSSGLWLGSWPGLLWTLLSAAQPCPPNNPVSSSSLQGFLAVPLLHPLPGLPVCPTEQQLGATGLDGRAEAAPASWGLASEVGSALCLRRSVVAEQGERVLGLGTIAVK